MVAPPRAVNRGWRFQQQSQSEPSSYQQNAFGNNPANHGVSAGRSARLTNRLAMGPGFAQSTDVGNTTPH